VCQTTGKCLLEDPLAKQKDAIWEVRWFVKAHPTGTYTELEEHLRGKGVLIPPQTLREIFNNALRFLEHSGGPISQEEDYKKILALLPK